MALKDWPERIRYTWKDEVSQTPYSLVFDNPASAIQFIISQRNNLVSADNLLASLSDADTGEALSDPANNASSDDIEGIAVGSGITLPEPEPVEPETDPTDQFPDDYTIPQSTDTTATANIVGTARPTTPAEVPPSNVETPQATTTTPTETVESGYVGTDGVTPVVASDAPSESLPDDSGRSFEDGTAESDVPAEDVPATLSEHDDEDDDFDSDIRHDDEPEAEDNAPSIGQPTAETPGVTGV